MARLVIGSGGPFDRICEALGLKNVRRLVLEFDIDTLATAYVQFYPEAGPLGSVAEILAECEKPKIVEVEAMGIDDKGGVHFIPKE